MTTTENSPTWVEERHFVSPAELAKVEQWFWDDEYIRRFVTPLLDIRPGCRVLDVGAGVGGLSRRLYGATQPSGSVTALDLRTDNAAAARDYASNMQWDNYHFAQGDARDLSAVFPSNSFDAVVEVGLLSNLSNADARLVAGQMVDVCAPGGHVAFIEIDFLCFFLDASTDTRNSFLEWAGYMVDGRAARGEGSLRSGLWLPGIVHELGLTDISVRPYAAPEKFPPYSPEVIALAADFGQLLDVNSDVHKQYRPILLAAGATEARLDEVSAVLLQWWQKRVDMMRADELPPLLAQVFVFAHATKP